jgi:hypothetical protein
MVSSSVPLSATIDKNCNTYFDFISFPTTLKNHYTNISIINYMMIRSKECAQMRQRRVEQTSTSTDNNHSDNDELDEKEMNNWGKEEIGWLFVCLAAFCGYLGVIYVSIHYHGFYVDMIASDLPLYNPETRVRAYFFLYKYFIPSQIQCR